MTVIALAFDAIHAESFFQHIQAMPCANTMNMRSGFGIACLIPHSVVLRQSGIYPVFPHPIDDKHAPLDAPWTGAKKPPSKGVTSLTNTNALSNLSAFRASDQVSTLCDRTTRAFLMNRGSRGEGQQLGPRLHHVSNMGALGRCTNPSSSERCAGTEQHPKEPTAALARNLAFPQKKAASAACRQG